MDLVSAMRTRIVGYLKKSVRKTGDVNSDITSDEREIIGFVKPYTMTSVDRIISLTRAIQYLVKNNIEGDIVECGVWKGGSVMAALKALTALNVADRKIWLFDTFEGMSEPTKLDKDLNGELAADRMDVEDKFKSNVWAYSTLEEVKANVYSVTYPSSNISFIKGKVEDTLPKIAFGNIALLRLDTDWYESTKVELELLYDRVTKGGIIIIDDYGHWEGCKRAVDEFFAARHEPVYLNRIDYTGRLIVKP